MPEPLEANLSLDYSDARSAVDRFASEIEDRLTQAVQAFTESFSQATSGLTVTPDVDTSQVAPAITDAVSNADATVAVTGDAENVTSAVDDAVTNADSTVVVKADAGAVTAAIDDAVSNADSTVSVDADTSAAEEAVSGLADKIQSGSGIADKGASSLRELGNSTALVTGASELAVGSVGGLKEVTEGLGLAGAGAIAGVTALGGAELELVRKGIAAQSAEESFNGTLGKLAKQVQEINVGTLSTDLKTLGLQFGSTDSDMKNTVTNLYQFATSSGASGKQAVDFSQTIVALAARAVSLRPSLGNVSDAADALSVRLSRGGRFAQTYGISLSQADITAKALTDTHKSAANELTVFDRSAAAAELSLQKYGGTLGGVVAAGAKNAANENKSLRAELDQMLEEAGKPLVGGFFDAVHKALPDVLAIAVPLGRIGEAVLPAIATAAAVTAPLLKVIADAFEKTPKPILAVAAGVLLLNGALGILGRLLAVDTKEEVANTAAVLENAGAQRAAGAAAAARAAETGAAGAAGAGGAAVAEGENAAATGLRAGAAGALESATVSTGGALAAVTVGIVAFQGTLAILNSLRDATISYSSALDDETKGAKGVASAHAGDLVNAYEKLSQKIYDNDLALVKSDHEISNIQGHWVRLTDQFGNASDKFIVTNEANARLTSQLRAFRDVTEANFGAGEKLNASTDKSSALYRGQHQILVEVYNAKLKQAEATHKSDEALNAENAVVPPLTQAIDAYRNATDKATDTTLDFKTALKNVEQINGDVFDSQTSLAKSTDALRKSLFENGVTFDANTDAGQQNRGALSALRDQIISTAGAIEQQSHSAKAGQDAMAFLTGQLENTLLATGMTRGAVDDLVRSLGLVPTDTAVNIHTEPALEQILNLTNALGNLAYALYVTGSDYSAFEAEVTGGGGIPTSAPGSGVPGGVTVGIDGHWYDSSGRQIPGHAGGGYATTGSVSVVGEQGPELFVAPANGVVVPNGQWQAALASLVGGGNGTTYQVIDRSVHVDTIDARNADDPMDRVRKVFDGFRKADALRV